MTGTATSTETGTESPPLVSVVIPVLRDTGPLGELLDLLPRGGRLEIIVVNGETGAPPDDALRALQARCPDVRWAECSVGRARQMNHGAALASARWLLFLHADSRLHRDWLDELERLDSAPGVVGGSYRFVLDSPAASARLIEWGVRQRVRWLGLAYGDQALFVRQEVFRALGGYRDLPVMEDIDLSRRLRRTGRVAHSSLPVLVSPRRWQRDGWWTRTAENVLLAVLFRMGASPRWLAGRYYGAAALVAYDCAGRREASGSRATSPLSSRRGADGSAHDERTGTGP